jgi:hypothetical protein
MRWAIRAGVDVIVLREMDPRCVSNLPSCMHLPIVLRSYVCLTHAQPRCNQPCEAQRGMPQVNAPRALRSRGHRLPPCAAFPVGISPIDSVIYATDAIAAGM